MKKLVDIHLTGSVMQLIVTEIQAESIRNLIVNFTTHPEDPRPWGYIGTEVFFDLRHVTGFHIRDLREQPGDIMAKKMVELAEAQLKEFKRGEDWRPTADDE